MSTTSDFNMLRLEAPRDLVQITNGTDPTEEAVEISNPASWVRSLVHQQQQAEDDLRQLQELCGTTIDRTDRRIRAIERAYYTLAQGTRYVYERIQAGEDIAEVWVRNELAAAANAYQTFARQVWQAIIERTAHADLRLAHQGTQLARLNDALAFLSETNVARNRHLAVFQGNVETWAKTQQDRIDALERQLADAQGEIRQVAAQVPLPNSPQGSTMSLDPVGAPPIPGLGTRPTPLAPFPPFPATPRTRAPVPYQPAGTAAGGSGGGQPPRPPRRPIPPTSPSPPPGDDDDDLYTVPPQRRAGENPRSSRAPSPAPVTASFTPAEIARLVGEGIAAARQDQRPEVRINTSRLKMKSPDNFDGKTTTNFNQWWESVVMYLGFCQI